MDMLPSEVLDWQARGRVVSCAGLDVFTLESGPRDGPVVVLLHGFPSSSYDWHLVVAHLGARRIVTFDLPGYGLSAKPVDYSYSLFEQADIAELVLRQAGVTRAVVVAHDMGTSVACELATRQARGLLSVRLDGVVLMNGSVLLELARLTPSQKLLRSRLGPLFARVANRRTFVAQLRRILAQPVPEAELHAMWALLTHADGKLRLPRISAYLDERERFRGRWIAGGLARLQVPLRLVWGRRDPIAVAALAERIVIEAPAARLQWLESLGHYPQLEDPAATAAALRAVLDEIDAEAGAR